MSAVVVVGAQWGDEGKGKVVDLYAPYADMRKQAPQANRNLLADNT